MLKAYRPQMIREKSKFLRLIVAILTFLVRLCTDVFNLAPVGIDVDVGTGTNGLLSIERLNLRTDEHRTSD